jgi:O-acetyl-ADP-ribose deacetylase (regulator of RNase III)
MPEFLSYVRGNVLEPRSKPAHILHVVNDAGLWGKGFVVALSNKWRTPEQVYRNAAVLELGKCLAIEVEEDVTVVNMIAQRGIYSPGHRAHQNNPLVYDALHRCLKQAASSAKEDGATLHMPKIGAGLARGDWSIISSIIESVSKEYQVNSYVYIL